MNYEDMSDFEINKRALHFAIASGLIAYWDRTFYEGEKVFYYGGLDVKEFDPCNNPSDAWPIIVESKISISHSIALYRADALVYDNKFDKGFKIFKQDSQLGDTSSRGALRAAMICFLKMKDAENDR
ncbi:NinX [Vibrio phage 1.030.O._10N.222.55.F9]|nr:NinX [Vibrio phage 1.030.O._10N.222.55.F9]